MDVRVVTVRVGNVVTVRVVDVRVVTEGCGF